MFTGLVQESALVAAAEWSADQKKLRLEILSRLPALSQVELGASVALNGACMTVVEKFVEGPQTRVAFEVSPESLALTNLRALAAGGRVHVELPLLAGAPLGGHVVSGHVDGVGRVHSRRSVGEFLEIFFEVIPPARDSVAPYLVSKGSVAVDGVSLTINEVRDEASSTVFSVMLIPHTLQVTRLGELQAGDLVNLEADLMAKHLLRQQSLPWAPVPGPAPAAGIGSVEIALDAIRSGKMVILVDDEDRENEGDLVLAAQFATPETINFMALHGRGLICLALEKAMIERLSLPMMTDDNQAPFGTAFTVSIEARTGVTTGISAADRAHTIQTAIRDGAARADLVVPGHVFPLRAREGGVLVRAGQTEGSVDLARLAGLKSAAVICEILNPDGTMSRMPDLNLFSKKFGIPIVSIADLILYRLHNDQSLVAETAHSKLPTKFGVTFDMRVFESLIDHKEHVALVLGDAAELAAAPTLVRVHSECLTGDVFGSLRCDCGNQLDAALKQIAAAGRGVLLYLRQEGRGIGLRNKVRAYELQDQGMDTVEANLALGFGADLRRYGIGAQILRSLGVVEMRLLSNNPKKIVGLDGFGLSVVERVPLVVGHNDTNRDYLETKKNKLGHLFT